MNNKRLNIARTLSILSYLLLLCLAILGIIIELPKVFIGISLVYLLTIFGFSFGYIVEHK